MAEQETVRTDRPIVVDATDHIAGRLSSHVAKLLLKGNRVSLVNCEKIMMSGTRANIIKEQREFLEINSMDKNCVEEKSEPVWNINYDCAPDWMKECFKQV